MLLTRNRGPPDGLLLPQRLFVDPPVYDKHDEDRCPEGERGGDESIGLVDSKYAFVRMSLSPFLQGEQDVFNGGSPVANPINILRL